MKYAVAIVLLPIISNHLVRKKIVIINNTYCAFCFNKICVCVFACVYINQTVFNSQFKRISDLNEKWMSERCACVRAHTMWVMSLYLLDEQMCIACNTHNSQSVVVVVHVVSSPRLFYIVHISEKKIHLIYYCVLNWDLFLFVCLPYFDLWSIEAAIWTFFIYFMLTTAFRLNNQYDQQQAATSNLNWNCDCAHQKFLIKMRKDRSNPQIKWIYF